MNILVTGATGVLGRPVVRLLVASGQQVFALSRSADSIAAIQQLGATPLSANLFESASLRQAMESIRADAILHLATKIPPTSRVGKRSSWLENDHLRRDGTRCLIQAATEAASVQRFIYPSYAFVYPDYGASWIDARTTPAQPHPVLQSTLDAEAALTHFASQGRHGITLRLACLYGPESGATREQVDYARKGLFAIPGPKAAYFPQLWVQDAASALVIALSASVPSGIYDVGDDGPLTRGELADVMAHAVGGNRLWQPPAVVMRMMAGVVFDIMSRSLRLSNRHFKEVSDWKPRVATAADGWARLGTWSRQPVITHP